MTFIAAARGVVGPYAYPQDVITDAFSRVVSIDGVNRPLIERIHRATGVRQRHLAIPLESYAELAA